MKNPGLEAEKILSVYWGGELPVQIISIAKAMGVEVRDMAGNAPENLSGAYDPSHPDADGKPVISVNPDNSVTHQRFTIAHELGHHVLHGAKSFRDVGQLPGTDQHEIEANAFAAALLMPASPVRVMYENAEYGLSGLSRIFAVSPEAMRWRLRNLGYNV